MDVSKTVTIACVLWEGNFRNRSYNCKWVNCLKSMVERNIKAKHRFVCLNNASPAEREFHNWQNKDIESIPLTGTMEGWWAKLEFFRPDIDLGERVLSLDLDTLIVGNLDEILEFPSKLSFAPQSGMWWGIDKGPSAPHTVRNVNSSCMVWTPPVGQALWKKWKNEYRKKYRSDQDWIGDFYKKASRLPGKWFTKIDKCWDGPPKDVKIIGSMHGKRMKRIREIKWIQEMWR